MKKNRQTKQKTSFLKSHLNQIILCLYLGTVFNIFIYLLIADYITFSPLYITALIITNLLVYLIAFFLSTFILKKISSIKAPKPSNLTRKQYFKIFVCFFLISLIIAFFWFFAYNPGGFSPDSLVQYNQAITGEYTDWHPALHTFLFFTIPLSIFHNVSSIVVCQIILFSAVLAYSATTIYKIANKKWSIITFLLVILNPWVLDELMFPWTNVAFGIMALLITTFCLKIYQTSGKWCTKFSHILLFAIVIGCATIFRHNGILFSAPLIFILYFFITKKSWLKLIIIFCCFIFLIKIPFYSILNVAAPNGRTTEITGLPMTILANVTKETPWVLNEETTNFMYEIAPPEKYQSDYLVGDFNSIKFTNNTNSIENAGILNIIGYTSDAFLKSPKAGLTALFTLTKVVYSIDGDLPLHNTPHINAEIDNPDIKYHGNPFLKSAIDMYRGIFRNSFLRYFGFIGITILIMLIFILGKNRWQKKGWQKILLCSPVLFYDFGTMLLLTGPEPRFFFINFLIYPSIIILSIIKPKETKS